MWKRRHSLACWVAYLHSMHWKVLQQKKVFRKWKIPLSSLPSLWASECLLCKRFISHKRAVRSEYVWIAFAVGVLGVTFNAVAAMDLGERRRHEGGRAEKVGVGKCAGKLHSLLIPVSPQNTLNLMGGRSHKSTLENITLVSYRVATQK